ncbi:hypothetical protein RXV95_01380 [Novosphingobium sp. ZN18A2]|uniref:hypothetical protein n=1 Tax=Novosphingobium sp. ZN18A2 TaxID=3079861 RepID=UPI0030CE9661
MKRIVPVMLLVPVTAMATSALAKDVDPANLDKPQIYKDVVECRAIADAGARLACYDRTVAALQQATDKRDVVIADKADVREARKGLFGFHLPTLKIFGGGKSDGKDEEDEIKQIESTLKSARHGRYGAWTFVLQDGAVWQQTDTKGFAVDPRAGAKIEIKRGAFGSYMASINGQPAVKVKRIE